MKAEILTTVCPSGHLPKEADGALGYLESDPLGLWARPLWSTSDWLPASCMHPLLVSSVPTGSLLQRVSVLC